MTALILLSPLALWVLYLAYTALWAARHDLRPEVRAIGLLVILVGFVADVLLNWTLGLALGITKDATLSQKCGRLMAGDGWRAKVARYLCANWLDPFQFGGHCK